jgi:hypothetical protein
MPFKTESRTIVSSCADNWVDHRACRPTPLGPRLVSGRRQSENSERRRQRHGSPSKLDRAQQASLVGGIGNSGEFELEARNAQQGEYEPQDCGEHRDPSFEFGDAVPQSGLAPAIRVERDDRPEGTTDPAHRRGARDLQLREQVWISCTDDLLLDAAIIGAPRAMGHPTSRPRWSRSVSAGKPSPKRQAISQRASASRQLSPEIEKAATLLLH